MSSLRQPLAHRGGGGPREKPIEEGFVKGEHVPAGDAARGHLVRVFVSEEEVECSAHGKRAA